MQRKWRTNRGALDTIVAYPDFRAAIPPREDAHYDLSDPTDLYAVYTVLHIENKSTELRWSPHGCFYYFLVQWQQAQNAEERQAAAPEGDEVPPPQIVPEGSEAALQQQADHGRAGSEGSGGKKARQQQQLQQQPQSQQETQQLPDQQQQDAAPMAIEQQQQAAHQGDTTEAAGAAAPAAGPSTAAPPPVLRTQIVVPISSAYRQLTPALLQRMFSMRGVEAQQLLLAMVDSNGVVTRSCLYNYIQAPLEGPGTANLELLDD